MISWTSTLNALYFFLQSEMILFEIFYAKSLSSTKKKPRRWNILIIHRRFSLYKNKKKKMFRNCQKKTTKHTQKKICFRSFFAQRYSYRIMAAKYWAAEIFIVFICIITLCFFFFHSHFLPFLITMAIAVKDLSLHPLNCIGVREINSMELHIILVLF